MSQARTHSYLNLELSCVFIWLNTVWNAPRPQNRSIYLIVRRSADVVGKDMVPIYYVEDLIKSFFLFNK